MFDIDIDFADRNVLLEKLKHRIAKLEKAYTSQRFHMIQQQTYPL